MKEYGGNLVSATMRRDVGFDSFQILSRSVGMRANKTSFDYSLLRC